MSKPVTAEEARLLVKAYVPPKYNGQQKYYFIKIEEAARRGETFIIMDDRYWRLFSEDIAAFEELGYKVILPGQVNQIRYGRISWNE